MGWCGGHPLGRVIGATSHREEDALGWGYASAQLSFPGVMQSGSTKRPLAVTA